MDVMLNSSWLRHTGESAALRIALGSNSGAFICFIDSHCIYSV